MPAGVRRTVERIGDLIWAAGDIMARGFLFGGTAGRTTLAGEGLQHQDGHSHVLALSMTNLKAYDPAFAYEIAVIVKEGIRRMYEEGENLLYYLTVMNETYLQPPMPKGSEDGILKGMYQFRGSKKKSDNKVNLFGSGTILNEVIKAAELLEDEYDVAANIWSVTSYKELYMDAIECERSNYLNPDGKPHRAYVAELLADEKGSVFVAASDYMKALPELIAKQVPGRLITLGTDGYGRSEDRASLRDFFEVDRRYVTLAALFGLAQDGKIDMETVIAAREKFDIDPAKINPHLG